MRKSTCLWKTLLSCVLIVGALLQGFSFAPAIAQTGEGEEDFGIYLAQGTFDPLQALPTLPQSLTFSEAEVAANGVYLVQFTGPIEDAWKENIQRAGGKLGPYIPNYAFVAKLDAEALARVRSLPEVRWVGVYEAAYKLAAQVTPDDTRTYRVLLAPWAQAEQNAQAMSAFAVRPVQNHAQPLEETQAAVVEQPVEQILAADLDRAGLEQAARMGDVLWIEPLYLNVPHNNIAGPIMGRSVAWNAGYTGSGVTINVTDTGLDTGAPDTLHADFRNRVANITSWPVVAADFGMGCLVQNPGADDSASDKRSGHGTHVTGSAAGDGTASGGTIQGMAPKASISFQAVEQWTIFSESCPYPSGYYLTGIPINLAPMFQQAYNWGARVQNESWGAVAQNQILRRSEFGIYDDQARQFDSFIQANQDFAVFVAAGNFGTDANGFEGDGYVDLRSISSPATAKNVITIGASENDRAGGGYAGEVYANIWTDKFKFFPTGPDLTSDRPYHLAAISSRGPMADGRIKPDLVAPGTNILSTRSSVGTGVGWGAYKESPSYMYMGGTSSASALAAGAGALVRQYYQTHAGVPNPSAALIKATLINTATDITGYGNKSQEAGQSIPNMHEGWGLINVAAATTATRMFVDSTSGLSTGTTHTYRYSVAAGKPFKVSLAWSDAPAAPFAAVTLVNNLNLRVTAPDGTVHLGNVFSNGWSTVGGTVDDRNTVENVYIQAPTAGVWQVEVIGQNVPNGPQRYALVVGGGVSEASPAAFAKTAPANNATGITTAALAWAPSIGAASYEYCMDTTANNTCDTQWIGVGSNRSVVVSGVSPGTTYSWQVRARNAVGVTEASGGWWKFTTLIDAPGAFSKTNPSNAATPLALGLTLSWDASARAASYEYCVDTINNASCDTAWVSSGANRTALLNNVTPLTRYYWQVRAKNAGGTTSANSGTWWSFTVRMPAPDAFSKTSPADWAADQPNNITLLWEASKNKPAYRYCIDTLDNDTCDSSWVDTGAGTTAALSGLNAGTTYYWQVQAANAGGTSDADVGDWWSFTTFGNTPGTFTKTHPSHTEIYTFTEVMLYWKPSPGAVSYEYCYDTIDDDACTGLWTPVGVHYIRLSLPDNTTYFWQVRAKNASGTVYANSDNWWTFSIRVPEKRNVYLPMLRQ